MGRKQSIVNALVEKLHREVSTRVHNRHLQERLQIGSSLALASGLIVNILSFTGVLNPLNTWLSYILLGPSEPGMVEQDPLVQMVVVFLLALLGGATLPHFHFLSATALTILYVVIYLGYAFTNFSRGIIVQPLYPLLGLVLTFASEMVFRYFSEERPRASIGRLFKRYVSSEAMDQVLKDYDRNVLSLEGIRREVTVLHVDLRELSVAADTLHPQSAVDLVNEYFNAIVPIIFHHAGTVVKQSGTGIVAVWNLPLENKNYAGAAVQAAKQICHGIAPLKTLRSTQDSVRPRIHLGIGISTGQAIGGYIGVPSHKEYTVIGEVTTIAERLAMKPDRGVFIDRATRERTTGEFELKEVNPIRLRRKNDPMTVWEVTDPLEMEQAAPNGADAAD